MEYRIEHEIHADLEDSCSLQFIEALKGLGFYDDRFLHPEGGRTPFVPLCHLTVRPSKGSEQRKLFDEARRLAVSFGREVEGYIESEVAHVISGFETKDFDPSAKLGFVLRNSFLPPGQFREDEIHVQFDKDQTDPRIGRAFAEAGWREAFCPEPYGVGEIWTIQGSMSHVEEVLPATLAYLNQVGGLVACTVRREVIAHWWLSKPDLSLPPVIAEVVWQ
jgi:hypothetical protein